MALFKIHLNTLNYLEEKARLHALGTKKLGL